MGGSLSQSPLWAQVTPSLPPVISFHMFLPFHRNHSFNCGSRTLVRKVYRAYMNSFTTQVKTQDIACASNAPSDLFHAPNSVVRLSVF